MAKDLHIVGPGEEAPELPRLVPGERFEVEGREFEFMGVRLRTLEGLLYWAGHVRRGRLDLLKPYQDETFDQYCDRAENRLLENGDLVVRLIAGLIREADERWTSESAKEVGDFLGQTTGGQAIVARLYVEVLMALRENKSIRLWKTGEFRDE